MARTLRQRFELLVDVVTGRSNRDVDTLGDSFDDAARKADKLDVAAGQVGDTSRRAIGGNAVGALRDLSGPLGEASTALGDFGDSFTVVGEQAAASLGLGEKAAGRLVTALGIAGAAVGGLITVWNQLREAQSKARQEVDDYVKALEQAKGRSDEAIRGALTEKLTDRELRALDRLGFNLEDLIARLTGAPSRLDEPIRQALDALDREVRQYRPPELAAELKSDLGVSREQAAALATVLRLLEDENSALERAIELWGIRRRVIGSGVGQGIQRDTGPAAPVINNIRVYTPRAGDPVETVDLTNRYVRTNGQNRGGAVAP